MSMEGLRVIAVASMNLKSESEISEFFTDCKLAFRGFVGLADSPRESVKNDIIQCIKAGIYGTFHHYDFKFIFSSRK